MIGAILNCRGVGKKGMSTYLVDFLKQQAVDFIGLQETIKKDYSEAFFRRIDPLHQFTWNWLPSVGRAGGILGGLRKSRFDCCNVSMGNFFVKMVVMDIKMQIKWAMVIVYGAAQEENKEDF
jgi:hypothetical protein